MGKIRNAFTKLNNKYHQWRARRQLKYTDFTVISNNCWAGTAIYQPFGLKYNTPTVGLFIMDEDYIRFLERLDWYLKHSLTFIKPEDSKYYNKISHNGTQSIDYPIAVLGNDVEIHFLHYHSQEEAKAKWDRRVNRVNDKKLLIKMSIRDTGYDIEQMLRRFVNLPFNNKVCFAPIKYDNSQVIEVPELRTLNLVGGDETQDTLRKVDIIELINSMQ